MTSSWKRTLLAIGIGVSLAATQSRAQVVREVRDFASDQIYSPAAIDDAGTAVYAVSTSNPYGTNPGNRKQIFRWDPASGAGTQVTNFEEGAEFVSVSDDGQWLAFVSHGDLTGSNHDESAEVFVMQPDGSGLSQLSNDTSLAGDGALNAIISGSGNRVAFVSDADPLGTNPGRTQHAFAVDRDGQNLVQLDTLPSSGFPGYFQLAISDDGSRVALLTITNTTPALHIYSVPGDASSPPSLVATGVSTAASIKLSGNGQKIVYGDYDGSDFKVYTVNWDGSGPVTELAAGSAPSITNDGQTVFYASGGAIWKIGIDGTGATLVASVVAPLTLTPQALSGDGSRLAALTYDPAVSNGDRELFAVDASAGSLQQLTDLPPTRGSIWDVHILAGGTRIYFQSNRDFVGMNPDRTPELYTVNPDGSGLAQVTNVSATGYINESAVSDAGLVVFTAFSDLTIPNTCAAHQVYKINSNGTGLTQLTGCAGDPWRRLDLQVLFSGQYAVYQGLERVGTNTDGSAELFRVATNGAGVTPITADNDGYYKYPRLSAAAGIQYVVYNSGANLDGQNPNNHAQIMRVPLLGTTSQRITADPSYSSWNPDISADATKVVWWSQADFTGANPNHWWQIFLWDATTGQKRQLTSAAGEYDFSGPPRISRDGAWVYYSKNGPVRQSIATGRVERLSGFGHSGTETWEVEMDSSGNRTVFVGLDVIDRSPSTYSIFMADQTIKPKIAVGRLSPTLVTWDPDPESVRYDVVRGDRANLAVAGGAIDLGPVTCLEDDSPDNHIRGFEDQTQPGPGQLFFYLYRGTTGTSAIAGSWGQGSGNRERIPGTGSCNP